MAILSWRREESTLLNLIAGAACAPASGTLLIAGDDHTLTYHSRRPVSMLFQENNLFSHLNVQQISVWAKPGLTLNASQREKRDAIACQMGIEV